MKTPWQAVFIPLFLITITACGELNVVSDTLSDTQKQQIKTNILSLYPDMDVKQQQQVADVAVKAIEDLIFVEGGSFEMGDIGAPCKVPSKTNNRIDWSPDATCQLGHSVAYLHKVTLSAYSISKYETIFADMALMRMVNNLPPPYTKFFASESPSTPHVDVTSYDDPEYQEYLKEEPKSPAPTKTWQHAKDYCLWLGKVTSLPFDLPTEAQWEYAARSRGQNYYFATDTGYRHTERYFNTITNEYYTYTNDQQNVPIGLPDSVDEFPPNPLGVYGMSNKISEWVNDWYSPNYYQNSPEYNPQGPDTGEEKVYRDIGEKSFTFVRSSAVGFNSYIFMYSFRCALQQTNPAI